MMMEGNIISNGAQYWVFMEAFNKSREQNLNPSEMLCVDESMSRWHGLGGEWPKIDFPYYVYVDRKPESGCDIWTTYCGTSDSMIHANVVKRVNEIKSIVQEQELNLSTAVPVQMPRPWPNSGRLVIADSWFASVSTAIHFFTLCMRFIGIGKNASSRYPEAELSSTILYERRRYVSIVSRD